MSSNLATMAVFLKLDKLYFKIKLMLYVEYLDIVEVHIFSNGFPNKQYG